MRRKPSQSNGGYNNQNRKPRYQGGGHQGGHQGHHHHNGGGRPRKNYAASREKYLQQARDALASGDRVLAENYYQHADHCYRMMVEEGYNVRNSAPVAQPGEQASGDQQQAQGDQQPEETIPENTNQLPAFITATYEQPGQAKPVDPASIQNWEERDA
jgi:hypothetical protein